MNVNQFLEDISSGVFRVLGVARQETALIKHNNEDGTVKAFIAALYFDDPELNQRVIDAIVAEVQNIEKERSEDNG